MSIQNKMKKSALIGCLILFFASLCFSSPKNKKPLWADLNTINQIFPSTEYVTGLAQSKNEQTAIALADGNLASYFSREITSITKANQTLSNIGDDEEKFHREITIKSQINLAGIQHTQVWFNSKTKEYYVCAYLNRKEAFSNYEGNLISSREKFYALFNSAEQEQSPFKKIKLFVQSKIAGTEYSDALSFAEILYRQGCEQFSKDRIIISGIDEKILQTKLNISMKVLVSGDPKNQYKSSVEKVLSENGYNIQDTGYSYLVDVAINQNKVFYEDTIVATPQVEIRINDKTEIILSFKKDCERISGFKEAELLVDSKINNEIKIAIEKDFAETLKALGAR